MHLPEWDIDVVTQREVPDQITHFGVRAFRIEMAQGPGENCYLATVAHTTDSRFDRSVLLNFCKNQTNIDNSCFNSSDDLSKCLYWRIDKLKTEEKDIPNVNEKLWVKIPKDNIYMVCK